MDNSLQELEHELKRLTPRRPSAGLIRMLERELDMEGPPAPVHGSPVPRFRSWKWAGWSLAGAAALAFVAAYQFARNVVPAVQPEVPATVAAIMPPTVQPEVAPVNRYQPVKATSVLYDLKEEGLTRLPDLTEGRQLRYRFVDTYTWKNPATNASLRWSVPRDEVRLVRTRLD